ncbi:MAG: peptidase C39 family protein [Chloroflexales bacterium]|nr:peptidase C39 family protein [Chloroflexales bacterium]
MRQHWKGWWLLIGLLVTSLMAAPLGAAETTYRTGFDYWRAADGGFSNWERQGVTLARDGTLRLDPAAAQRGVDPYPAGGYFGGNYYNGGEFLFGEATSPLMSAKFPFAEAIASWNAATPAGTWLEVQIRAQVDERLTKWYSLGIWAADNSTIQRHSVRRQGDANGFVAVDTLILYTESEAFQLKVRLFSADGRNVPTLRNASLAYSTESGADPTRLRPGAPRYWNTMIETPQCSQMVYPDGGVVWCSPTSTSMVLGYWTKDRGPCEPRVRTAVDGVYDWVYDGHGNWPFNTAYAATQGMEGYVARFSSLAQAEPLVAAGIPVVFSFAWGEGELTGAAIPWSNGHLAVLVGFDAQGNPIVNDPAAANDQTVQRTYLRHELETLWLRHSGGTTYIIFPETMAPPRFRL